MKKQAKHYQQWAWLGLSIWLAFGLAACNKEGYKSALKRKEQRGEYDVALNMFEKLLGDKKYQSPAKQAELNYQMAESYRLSNRMPEALPYYEKALELGKDNPEIRWHYAYGLKLKGKYDEAKSEFEKLKRSADTKIARRADDELEHLEEVKHLSQPHENISVSPVSTVNTGQSDYAPVVLKNKFYFSSARRQEAEYAATGGGYDDLFSMDISGMDVRGEATPLAELNLDGRHDATCTFSPNGKTVVFARSSLEKEKEPYEVNLFISQYVDGAWTEPEPLPFNSEYWDGTPAFSSDGSRIFFASNRPYENPDQASKGSRSYGGLDLFEARKDRRRGIWTVRNLGRKINTPGNEMFPYISKDNALYFASDGHPGLGGLDLFKSTRSGRIITVNNLGAPINSSYDDFALCKVDSADGFFTSNRKSATGGGNDDIYRFHIDPPKNVIVRYWLAGIAYGINELNGDTLRLANTKVYLHDMDGNVLDSMTSAKDGEFDFQKEIEIDKKYKVIARKSHEDHDYQSYETVFSTVGKGVDKSTLLEEENDITFEQDVYLPYDIFDEIKEGKTIDVYILYDLDDDRIRNDAKPILDKVVSFLKENPDVKIELGSHTDARASKTYNQALSERRAMSAVQYIAAQGIPRNRMVAKGYGETDLKIPNAETEEEHQANRRTTIKAVEQ